MNSTRINCLLSLVLGTLLLAGVAPSAFASDATGTWEGKYSCREYYAGVKIKFTVKPSVMKITQVSDTDVRIDLDEGEFHYDATVIPSAKRPTKKGKIGAASCFNDGDTNDGEDEVIRFSFKGNPEAVKATLTGRATYQGDYDGDAYVGECKWAFKRVSTTDPEVESCVAED